MPDILDYYNHTNLRIADKSIDYAQIYVQLLDNTATFVAGDTAKHNVDGGAAPATITMTIATPCVITDNAHGFAAGRAVMFKTTGALPTGLTAGTWYYVVNPLTNTYNLALTPGGAAINTTGSQSGTHTRHVSGTKEMFGNGWPPGGVLLANCTWAQVALDSGVANDARLSHDTVSVTASGGPIPPAAPAYKAAYYDKSTMRPFWFLTFNSAQQAGATTDFKITPTNGLHTLTKSG